MVIKDVIKLYDDKNEKMGLPKTEKEKLHAVVCDFFAFVVNSDLEITFYDKRCIPASELVTKESK